VAGVDEQFGRRPGDQDVGLAGVDADVASALTLLPQYLGQLSGSANVCLKNSLP
jgi:hypothetical protein